MRSAAVILGFGNDPLPGVRGCYNLVMAEKKKEPGVPGAPQIFNKKARFDYHIEESLEAGLVLEGSEVKSLRLGRASLEESFARVHSGEVILYGMHISPYEQATVRQHEPNRPRKLLLHRREIRRVIEKATAQGFTLIPLKLYWKRGNAKIELGIARGKREFDKRESIKKRDTQREVQRVLAGRRQRR